MTTSLEWHIDGMLQYPKLSKLDMMWVYTNYHRLEALENEVATLRAETEKQRNAAARCKRKLTGLQVANEQEAMRASTASSALKNAEDMADIESTKAREAEEARKRETLRAKHLDRRVKKLEKDLRNARGSGLDTKLSSSIKLMAKSRLVGKRLAAACHPDKVPPELSADASQLFRFVQSIRSNAE